MPEGESQVRVTTLLAFWPKPRPRATPVQAEHMQDRLLVSAGETVKQGMTKTLLYLCLVLDVTASMDDVIHAVVTFLQRFIDMVESEFDVRIGLVTFKDYEPGNKDASPIQTIMSFQEASAVRNHLNAVKCSGGDDLPEAQGCALKEALDLFTDATGGQKMTLLITDSAPHGQGDEDDNYPFAGPDQIDYWGIIEQFKKNEIPLSVLGCKHFTYNKKISRSASNVYAETADRTNGRLFDFEHCKDNLDEFLSQFIREEHFVLVCVEAARKFPDQERQIEQLCHLMSNAPVFRSLSHTITPVFNKGIFTNCRDSFTFSRAVHAASHGQSAHNMHSNEQARFRSLSCDDEDVDMELTRIIQDEDVDMPLTRSIPVPSTPVANKNDYYKTSYERALAYLKAKGNH